MSLQKSSKRDLDRREMDASLMREKGSYTQEGFHRKPDQTKGMNLSNLSQKQSIYDQKGHALPAQTTSQMGYSPLRPSKHTPTSTYPPKQQEYQILTEFELKREREKNRILEERLKNKQIFIGQMKHIQDELTLAFQKCQEELEYYKKRCAQPSNDAREYLEEINQLKHLVIRLEDKITDYQKRDKQHYSSVKNNANAENAKIPKERDSDNRRERAYRDKRSKTTANNQDSSPEIRKGDLIQQYVIKFPNRFTNFVERFLSMVEFFSEQAQIARKGEDRANVKKRLKISWKWIKQIVGEWNELKLYKQHTNEFINRLRSIFEVPTNTDDQQAMQMIISSLN